MPGEIVLRTLNDLTLRELRYLKDRYKKNITIKQLGGAIKQIAKDLEVDDEVAFEAYKLAVYDTFDLYERKGTMCLN